MLGKFPTQLIRLSCMLHGFHEAFDFGKNISNEKFNLNENLDNQISCYVKLNELNIISEENVNRAFSMLGLFNKNKLILAGYKFEAEINISKIFSEIILNNQNDFILNKESKSVEEKIASLILLSKVSLVKLNEINQKMSKKVSINIIENVCKDLEKAELGKRTSQPNTNGPPTKYFKKCFINELI